MQKQKSSPVFRLSRYFMKQTTNKLSSYLFLALIMLGVSHPSFSAIDALSHHSRANCAGFNETTTWWLGHAVEARVVGRHYPECKRGSLRNMHEMRSPRAISWRHIVYHPTESYGGDYCVVGNHFMYYRGVEHFVQSETEYNCAIYDGWWDY